MSKYKVGDKVVMKIISADQDEIKTYSVSGVNNDWRWCLPQNLLERYIEPLSTYTEPLEAKIRRQAAEITRLLSENERLKPNYENIRAKGQNEAWELAKKIVDDVWNGGYSEEKLKQIFGYAISQLCIVKNTYSEAAAKVTEWEKAKEEIKRGDEVEKNDLRDVRFIVTFTNGKLMSGVTQSGLVFSNEKPKEWHKTGRHIDIDSFLKQIGAE